MSSSKPQICFLLALWGKSYIDLFCDISLRSLLAAGNIPALAKEYRCTFTLLTMTKDIKYFELQPLFMALKKYGDISYVDIHDIIYPHNHSATLTVALERGMRSRGTAMLDTYFIFLVGDYLFAEQSLSGLLPHLRKGVSAITAGNYQVVEEEVMDDVKRFIDPKTGIISVPNRALVAWSLKHLHPMTVANTVNTMETHTLHTNRLFWRVGDDTLVGRFYLRHMLCIKPEIADYVIGASCDYSFIEEMCPSGNVVHLADSDEYFIVELQPLLHEGIYIAVGSHVPEDVAESLAQWATAGQRANAHIPVVFHSGEISAATTSAIEESERYIRQVEQAITTPPLSVHGHYYWQSCIQSITAKIASDPEKYSTKIEPLRRNIWDSPVFSPPFTAPDYGLDRFPRIRDEDVLESLRWILPLYRWYVTILGRLPDAHLWHPHYLDYKLLKRAMAPRNSGPVMLVLPPQRRQWYDWKGAPEFILRSPLIAYRNSQELRAELKNFSCCVIHLTDEYDAITGMVFDRLLQAMPAGSRIHIFIKPSLFTSQSYTSRHRALRYAHLGQKPGVSFAVQCSYKGRVRRLMDRWMSAAISRLIHNRLEPLSIVFYGSQVLFLHLAYVVHNAVSLLLHPFDTHIDSRVCSAVFTFEVDKKA